MKRKNICIVLPGVYPIPDVKGGAVERLMTMIAEDNERFNRFNLTVISCNDAEAKKLQSGFKNTIFVNKESYSCQKIRYGVHKLRNAIERFFHIKKQLHWLVWANSPVSRYLFRHRNDFDLVVNEFADSDICATASRYSSRDKFVMHLHVNTFASATYERTFGNVVAVSDFIMDQYRKDSLLADKRTATIFNGIATENFRKTISAQERCDLRKSLGFSDDDFVVIFCGRIAKTKGVKELMIALSMIDNDKIKLLILGASDFGKGNYGQYPDEVNKLVEENKNRVVFSGFVKNDELYKYHQIADVGAIPSLYNDPCPLSMFEMITSKLPTIATKAGGMTEIGNDKTTIYVSIENIVDDLRNAITLLYKNGDIRARMSGAAKERAEYFKRDRFYHDFCNTMEQFIELNQQVKK